MPSADRSPARIDRDENTFPTRAALQDAVAEKIARAGDYRLEGFIAEGGFGVIYRAVHVERGTLAAVKILHPDLVTESGVLLRFEREAEAMRRIGHPNVVKVFDVGWLDNGRPYFAMELLAGTTLERHLQTRGRLPADELLGVLEPLCDALAVAHRRGIIHRDIKPSNVFLAEEGGTGRPVLLDFGVAKLFDAEGPSLTSSRNLVGTPAFMSPEQLLNLPVDARTDVYALGTLLYTMITGTPPFRESAYPVLRQLHLYCTPPRPSARAPVSPMFDGVILRAMAKNPLARHPDVGAFLAEIRAAASQAAHENAGQHHLRSRRALGLHVEIMTDTEALESPTERLLADIESILPFALGELSASGFTPVVVTGTSALLTAPFPAGLRRDREARRGAVHAATSLHLLLLARKERDPRVRVSLCVHAGEVSPEKGAALTGGDLLDVAGWVPEGLEEGVYASAAILDGLDMLAQPGAPAARGAVQLFRVIGLTA